MRLCALKALIESAFRTAKALELSPGNFASNLNWLIGSLTQVDNRLEVLKAF